MPATVDEARFISRFARIFGLKIWHFRHYSKTLQLAHAARLFELHGAPHDQVRVVVQACFVGEARDE